MVRINENQWKPMKNQCIIYNTNEKSTYIHEKSMKMKKKSMVSVDWNYNENQWKSKMNKKSVVSVNWNQLKSMKINEKSMKNQWKWIRNQWLQSIRIN